MFEYEDIMIKFINSYITFITQIRFLCKYTTFPTNFAEDTKIVISEDLLLILRKLLHTTMEY